MKYILAQTSSFWHASIVQDNMNNIANEYVKKVFETSNKVMPIIKTRHPLHSIFPSNFFTFSLSKSQLLTIKLKVKYISLKYVSIFNTVYRKQFRQELSVHENGIIF